MNWQLGNYTSKHIEEITTESSAENTVEAISDYNFCALHFSTDKVNGEHLVVTKSRLINECLHNNEVTKLLLQIGSANNGGS